ncbi:MAG: ABC transporter ATP-binding protein [Calditrichaeota bacterium]|jgi:oligopeptide/dipeptide ABC transporter ATP-binding protein|nr:ABC transporter ATP-binding protein [Calditrichota bacterium]
MNKPKQKKLIEVSNLSVCFDTDEGRVQAVRDVSFYIRTGEIIGVVGESGSGKSVTTSTLLGWVPGAPGIVSGEVTYYDEMELPHELFSIEKIDAIKNYKKKGKEDPIISEYELSKRFKKYRHDQISMIFQEPKRYLHPFWSVEKHFKTILIPLNGETLKELATPFLEIVGLNVGDIWNLYPHNLSGGMNQRLMISLALSRSPRILIADEMTTGLDVTTQVRLAEMLSKLIEDAEDENRAIIMISHDIAFVLKIVNVLMVMYAGDIVEFGPAHLFYDDDQEDNHPYTNALLNVFYSETGAFIEGDVPSSINPPRGCPFRERNCPVYKANMNEIGHLCEQERPQKYFTKDSQGHWVRCHKFLIKPWSDIVSS